MTLGLLFYRCRKGTNERNHEMMTKTSDTLYKNDSYEDTFVASYAADHEITEAEADNLIATKYHMFPITGASYVMSDNHLVITYTVDHCN